MNVIEKPQLRRSRRRARRALLIAALLSSCVFVARAQQPPAGRMRLAKIEVVGLQGLKEEQVVAASGLKAGQTFTVEDFDAAAQKLLSSGLVSKVAYKLRERAGEAFLTFEVEEAGRSGNSPVVFDNFPWFTPEEIAAEVRRDVPAFDGTAPDSSAVIESIKRALARLLAGRKIAGQVEYMPSMNLETGGNRKHVFTVNGARLKVCAVSFPGASGVTEKELIATAHSILANDYSQEFASNFADVALRELYHERGYLRVEFDAPRASIGGEGASCADGVAVAVPVREGVSYNWAGAEWSGNSALTPAELDAALGMRQGEVANGAKIKQALRGVARAYGHKGYLSSSLRPAPEFDGAGRRVTYRFEVREGAQFRMGELKITGLAEADAEKLRARWTLRAGEVFDATYYEDFLKKNLSSVIQPGARPQVTMFVKPDREKLTADVNYSFKFGGK
ncbi:MAG TPA: POTRA domain-containing protein [Pyrinomonadaceae bacterium]|jgi:outer membrane protein assembly factor BamA|nr:POTRA domain-containing protein [Pyrinomonadaceae bacterium]